MHVEMMNILDQAKEKGIENEFLNYFYLIMSYVEDNSEIKSISIIEYAEHALEQCIEK